MLGNFSYHNPTKLYFGDESLNYLKDELKNFGPVVLLNYGSGSVKRNGIYDQVMAILKEAGKTVVENPGVMSNPTLEKLNEGVKIARENNVDWILALGGGSVCDYSQFGGSRLVVMTAEDAKLKVGVYYVDEGESELMDAKYTKRHVVELDNTKKIQKVLIQNQEAGTVTFVSMAIDPSEIETNATAIAVEVGLEAGATEGVTEADESTGNTVQTAISEGTVTITPTAGVGYAVKRVVVEQLVNPSNADQAVLSGARQLVPGVGNYDAVSVTDNGDGTYSFDMPAASVRILTDFEFTFLAPTASYDGQTHLVTLTDENESGTQKMYYSTDGKASWTE